MPAFTENDARRLLSEDGTSCTIPDTFTSIGYAAFYNGGTKDFSSLHTVVSGTITSVGAGAFRHCRLKSITIPDAAINNNNYGISSYSGNYYDPFYGCTELTATAQLLNMSVKEYLLHQNSVNRRVAVLFSIKTINNARILATSEGRAFIWGDPDGPEDRRRLNGVLARIPPFDMSVCGERLLCFCSSGGGVTVACGD